MRVAFLLLTFLIAANAVSRPAAAGAAQGKTQTIDLTREPLVAPDTEMVERLSDWVSRSALNSQPAAEAAILELRRNLSPRHDI